MTSVENFEFLAQLYCFQNDIGMIFRKDNAAVLRFRRKVGFLQSIHSYKMFYLLFAPQSLFPKTTSTAIDVNTRLNRKMQLVS